MPPVRLSYLICTTPRTGSNFLCEVLSSLDVAGRPDEYFWNPGYNYERRGVSDFPSNLQRMLRQGSTPNGVFGLKMMWSYLEEVLAKLAVHAGLEDAVPLRILEASFPNPHFAWLRRRDKLRQAISFYRAIETGRWRSTDTTDKSELNHEAIRSLADLSSDEEQAWEAWFEQHGIAPLVLFYEDLAAAPVDTALEVLKYLEIPVPEDLPTRTWQHRRQADDLTEEWVERYRRANERGG